MIWNRFASLTILCEILFFFSQLNVVSISLCVKILQESGEITCHGMDFDDILTSSDKICGADKILIANASAIYSSVCLWYESSTSTACYYTANVYLKFLAFVYLKVDDRTSEKQRKFFAYFLLASVKLWSIEYEWMIQFELKLKRPFCWDTEIKKCDSSPWCPEVAKFSTSTYQQLNYSLEYHGI